jgi:hypothetical protein
MRSEVDAKRMKRGRGVVAAGEENVEEHRGREGAGVGEGQGEGERLGEREW